MGRETELARYLTEVFGQAFHLQTLPLASVREVPLFLRTAYRFARATLLGRTFLVAIEPDGVPTATPTEYARHAETLRSVTGLPVALVLLPVPTHVRNRLVHQGVPFVVPGRQMFLPFLALDLREHDSRPVRGAGAVLTGAAQAVLLGHLLGRPVADVPLGDVAVAFGYSAMTLTKIAVELASAGLATATREGRTRRLRFAMARPDLWQRALPLLASPVRLRVWVSGWGGKEVRKVAAGLTALERCTDIADDRIPTYAMTRPDLRAAVARGDLVTCESEDEAMAAIEGWRYDPATLATGDCVDRLSLYLALRDTADERVQKELRTLLEGVGW
jgi:hypothetical protein